MHQLIWLASYPRSGNTLVRHTLEAAWGIKTQSIYPDQKLPEMGRWDDRHWPTLFQGAPPWYVKTHEWQHALSDAAALWVVRDGRDALVSHAHFRGTNDGDTRPFPLVLHDLIMAGEWTHHALLWLGRTAPTAMIRFESLVADPVKEIAAAAAKLGNDLGKPSGKPLGFAESQKLRPEFFRRGRVGAWRDEFPPALLNLFWHHHGHAMSLLGYNRDDQA